MLKNAFILDKNSDCIMALGPWAGIDTRVRLMDISGACEVAVALLEPKMSRVSDGVESNHQSQKCEGWFCLHKLIVESETKKLTTKAGILPWPHPPFYSTTTITNHKYKWAV